MENDGASFSELRVDGGMISNDWVSQQLSSVLNRRVLRPKIIETTALGAAYLASIQIGLSPDLESLSSNLASEKIFIPDKKQITHLEEKYKKWKSAVERTKGLF